MKTFKLIGKNLNVRGFNKEGRLIISRCDMFDGIHDAYAVLQGNVSGTIRSLEVTCLDDNQCATYSVSESGNTIKRIY